MELPTKDERPPNEAGWSPSTGDETSQFLSTSVPENSRSDVLDDAKAILGRCVAPNTPKGRETGLVIGYVQSGKTMSFEAVAALARDNKFHIIIVVAGTSNPLLSQSRRRLQRDLGLNDPARSRRWVQFVNPSDDDTTVRAIRDVLDDWKDPSTPSQFRRTILITVLKHYGRLQNLTRTLDNVGTGGVAVLIIDDEADQASLNTEVAQGDESSTYSRLCELRDVLPNHTYIQYTATPQAPLLINIIDTLSPNFVRVLNPGADYVGGRDFFIERSLARVIPPQDVPSTNNPLDGPPDSLILAMQIFVLGVAAGLESSGNTGNRSMLVHPSVGTLQHQEYFHWVRSVIDEWKRTLRLDISDPDRQNLVEEFRRPYDDLRGTVGAKLPSFERLMEMLPLALRNTRPEEVNAREGRTPEIDWMSSYGWILVGGRALERGFTVEQLTVTYMPRGVGVGNADSIQQRARFFGYKRKYIEFCRVYLEQGTLSAFEDYVHHEEDIRRQLLGLQNEGGNLNSWKRAFLLDRALRPCRNSVLQFDYIRGGSPNSWVFPKVVHTSIEVLEGNRHVVSSFVENLDLKDDTGHPDRTPWQKHKMATHISLSIALEQLLVQIRIAGTTDSQINTGLLLQLIKAIEDNENESCIVYQMSPNAASRRSRVVNERGEVSNIFQGEAPVNPREIRGTVYPGDRALHADDLVTIQIHALDLTKEKRGGPVVMENVPVVAVWVPPRLARGWINQNQPHIPTS